MKVFPRAEWPPPYRREERLALLTHLHALEMESVRLEREWQEIKKQLDTLEAEQPYLPGDSISESIVSPALAGALPLVGPFGEPLV